VRWLDNGAVFPAIEEAIRGARSSVNVTLYIWRPGLPGDAFIPLFAERVRAGVKCRVLVDPVGSVGFDDKVAPALRAAGCEVRVFRPLPADENLARQHRKLVIVDGKVGFTGGFGFHDVWLSSRSSRRRLAPGWTCGC
jgi:cardiolipin synthase